MTMAAAITSRTADANVRTQARRIARIDILSNLADAEATWRSLETQGLCTAYQRFDLLKFWHRCIAERSGTPLCIAIGYDHASEPLVLLPLELRQKHGVRIACFMGGKHTTFNMGLWDRNFARQATADDLGPLMNRMREKADVLALTQQPVRWQDLPNPFSMLPRQPSVNDCPVLTIATGTSPTASISNSLRRRLKAKERKLERLAGYRYHVPSTEAEIERLLDWYFRVKPARMAEQNLPNVFAEPGVERFVRDACSMPLRGSGHAVDIHALECNDEIIALFAGVSDGHRFSMMFNTYTMSDNSRYSPGLILIRNIVDYYAARGYQVIDLGVGDDHYKRLFCKTDEALFDSFIPLSPRGTLAAAAMSGMNRTKRVVKRSKTLLRVAQSMRRAFHQKAV